MRLRCIDRDKKSCISWRTGFPMADSNDNCLIGRTWFKQKNLKWDDNVLIMFSDSNIFPKKVNNAL